MNNDTYWTITFTDPDFDVESSKSFKKDERVACHTFVCELQEKGVKDIKVKRFDDPD
jgi:hypothetical protein